MTHNGIMTKSKSKCSIKLFTFSHYDKHGVLKMINFILKTTHLGFTDKNKFFFSIFLTESIKYFYIRIMIIPPHSHSSNTD